MKDGAISMKTIVERFWHFIDQADFEQLGTVMAENAQVFLPNTCEVFKTTAKYIAFNKAYPGRWHANIERINVADDQVITTVRISAPDQDISAYVTSYFELREGKIIKITEYWGDNGNPPEWRLDSGFSEWY